MAVTRSWESSSAQQLIDHRTGAPERIRELIALLGASVLVAAGLLLVFNAKTEDFGTDRQRLASNELINLNAASNAQVAAVLQSFTNPLARDYIATRVWSYVDTHRPLPNDGALSHVRITAADALANPQARELWSTQAGQNKPASLAAIPLSKLKPLLVVRTPDEFRRTFLLWILAYFAGFWVVHIVWHVRRFRGDPTILPAIHLLTGMGLILMVSLRDPLRDTLEFKKFAWGVLTGCVLLLLPLIRPLQYRIFSRSVYAPLFAAFGFFLALVIMGSGPTGSDAKVNLGPIQPVEFIKILVVFFLAGYFAQHWERLRDLYQKEFIPRSMRWLEIPRFSHTLPVLLGVICALLVFFLLKDMGPALVCGFVFMTMFAIARGRAGLPAAGLFLLVAGVTIGLRLGKPDTVVKRVSMWLSPWDNDVRGGDQLAHSLWAFATGGPLGSGPGWGDPSVIPAGHTDLVLASIGEEWGLPGVVSVALLVAILVLAAFRIARKAPDEYGTFLAAGLGSLVALEILLISAGALGAIPLSGVVSPFLSSGNTAMLANFFLFAMLLGISNQTVQASAGAESATPDTALELAFRKPLRIVAWTFAGLGMLLIARAAYLQVFHDRELMVKETNVITQDNVKRAQRNPRLNLLAAEIPRGNIYDRNNILLATSSWSELESRRADYSKLGVSIDAISRLDNRYYPFGPATVHLLGDLRTGEQFHATNSSLIEHDSNGRLQGYTGYDDLAKVVRYRHQRDNPALQELFHRDRDVHSTIDIRFQLKANEILSRRLTGAGKKGALVVMNAQTGDVLALVSWPTPPGRPAATPATPDQLLDRARYGQYPPGSTFKLVTAIAALRLNPQSVHNTYKCAGLGDGRVGTVVPGWRRPVRDDIGDHAHGSLDMANAITVSCNAYFAQLGVFAVGAQSLRETSSLLGIPTGTEAQVKQTLPFAAYGQGTVVATPFKMARVAATIADGGLMPEGRWVTDPSNSRLAPPNPILEPNSAAFLQHAMRSVVTNGTGRSVMTGLTVEVAGKTGTAQMDEGEPHSWFAGFAPYNAPPAQRLAFAVVVEHGGYGAKFAAPVARELVEAAASLNLFAPASQMPAKQVPTKQVNDASLKSH